MVFAAILITAVLTGCGYGMETPGLPGGATSISLDTIQNHTEQGGLDVQLKSVLRQTFAARRGFRLTSREVSDTVLQLELTNFTVSRAISITNTNISHLSYSLNGKLRLLDNRQSGEVLIDQPIAVSSTVIFSEAVLETPAVRRDALDKLVLDYAAVVESHLYNHF